MGWFNIFSKSKVDKDILDLYLEIEIMIDDVNQSLQDYFRYLSDLKNYKSNPKDKSFYSIKKVSDFFKKLKEDYAYCYTLRKNKKHYDFTNSPESRAEKLEIENELKKILNLLNEIYNVTCDLKKTNTDSNDFFELVKYIEDFIKTETVLKEIQLKDERLVYLIVGKIIKEAGTNEKKSVWLLNQENGGKLFFSQTLPLDEIKYLDLVPLLKLKGLDKRSLFINQLHRDRSLPVYHYNLIFRGKNIHVVPRNYQKKIEPYLIAAQ